MADEHVPSPSDMALAALSRLAERLDHTAEKLEKFVRDEERDDPGRR